MEHFHKADLYRLEANVNVALAGYQAAIGQLASLAKDFSNNPEYRADLASAYNWLGETQRPFSEKSTAAFAAYDNAIVIYADLFHQFPGNVNYRSALANTYNNRGLLSKSTGRYGSAEADLRYAITLLKPLTTSNSNPSARAALARVYNNLALPVPGAAIVPDAAALYNSAIEIGEALIKQNPKDRETALELAQYYNNSAILLQDSHPALATHRNARAIVIVTQLSEPMPYLLSRMAVFHTLRGRLLEHSDPPAAAAEYQQSIDALQSTPAPSQDHFYHVWLGEALTDLAEMHITHRHDSIQLLLQAIEEQKSNGSNVDLAWDYFYLAKAYQSMHDLSNMQAAEQNARAIVTQLQPSERMQLVNLLSDLPH
jgi:tetratricopeptide (TPR) repeat protein